MLFLRNEMCGPDGKNNIQFVRQQFKDCQNFKVRYLVFHDRDFWFYTSMRFKPANQILRTCCKAQDGAGPSPDRKRARGRPPITWI